MENNEKASDLNSESKEAKAIKATEMCWAFVRLDVENVEAEGGNVLDNSHLPMIVELIEDLRYADENNLVADEHREDVDKALAADEKYNFKQALAV